MAEAVLRLEQVTKRYRKSGRVKVALEGVSFELARGELVGVSGPNGAGKTTLTRVAAGLLAPDSGAVTYEGERLDRMASSQRTRLRRREIACIWSDRRFDDCVGMLDHVMLPMLADGHSHRIAGRRAREALSRCELEPRAEIELGELSDGERQRVEIARALVIQPRLLIADGPTADLPLVDQEMIMVLLASLARRTGAAVLVTARDTGALLRADPIFYLRDGALISCEPEPGTVVPLPLDRSRRAAGDA
jgi:putative ABC transport system ATP-binding protein